MRTLSVQCLADYQDTAHARRWLRDLILDEVRPYGRSVDATTVALDEMGFYELVGKGL